MAPIWFHLNLYSIIDIHVFLVNILFDLIYMNSSILTGLFLDIKIWIDSIVISPYSMPVLLYIQIIAEWLRSYS